MSDSYGLTMKGPFIIEKLDSLPTWASTDEGRMVYNKADDELYIGNSGQWEKTGSSGYGSTDTVFNDNDNLIPGTIYFINTTTSPLTGILPSSPSIGQVVTIVDDAGMFKGHPFYVNGNGKNIMGETNITLSVRNSITELIYNGVEWKVNTGGTREAIGGGTSSTGGVGNVIHVTNNYTAFDNDFIFVEADTGAVVITLPSSGLANGSAVSVYDQRGAFTEEPCIVNGGGNNIMGKSTLKIKTNYARVDFIWDKNDAEWKTVFSIGNPQESINVVDKSTNYLAEVNDFIMADTTAGSFTITLPTSGSLIDKAKISVIDQMGTFGSYVLNVIPSDGTINGDSVLVCDIPGLKVDFIWDSENSQWKVDFGGSVLASTSSTVLGETNWEVKTSDFIGYVNKKYIVDTTNGAIILTLPATAYNGEFIKVSDGGNFSINNLTVARNGNIIENLNEDMIVSTENQGFELIFYNGNWILA